VPFLYRSGKRDFPDTIVRERQAISTVTWIEQNDDQNADRLLLPKPSIVYSVLPYYSVGKSHFPLR
jgi:hypothetical protein